MNELKSRPLSTHVYIMMYVQFWGAGLSAQGPWSGGEDRRRACSHSCCLCFTCHPDRKLKTYKNFPGNAKMPHCRFLLQQRPFIVIRPQHLFNLGWREGSQIKRTDCSGTSERSNSVLIYKWSKRNHLINSFLCLPVSWRFHSIQGTANSSSLISLLKIVTAKSHDENLISDQHGEHDVSPGITTGRTAAHLRCELGEKQLLIWNAWGEDSSRNSACTLQGCRISQLFFFKLCLSICARADSSAFTHSLNDLLASPSPFWRCCHRCVLRLLIKGRHYHRDNGCTESQSRTFPITASSHSYLSLTQRLHHFLPEKGRLKGGNFALIPLLFLVIKISMDN